MNEIVKEPSPTSRPPQIGNSKGDKEGIGRHPGAEEMGDDHVPQKTEDTAEESPDSDGRGCLGDFMVFGHIIPSTLSPLLSNRSVTWG